MPSHQPSALWHLRLGQLNLLLHRRTWLLSLLVLTVLLALVIMTIKIGRAHVWTPVTIRSRMPSSA